MEQNIYSKLLSIQSELKAPKGQQNSFGHYNYRSNEDILEAVKPLLLKYNLSLRQSDDVVEIGGRVYVKATSTLLNIDKPEEVIVNTAFAREEPEKKGMDGSQITGASSSYARKYSLNGLFVIDDNEDSDTTNLGDKPIKKITGEQIEKFKTLNVNIENILIRFKVEKIEDLDYNTAEFIIKSKEKAETK